MTIYSFKKSFKLLLFAFTGFLFSACTDSDYDLSNVDATIGITGDSIDIPSNNSTEEIYLDEFLKIDESNFIAIEPVTYDYLLQAKSANNKIEFLNIPSFLKDKDAHVNFFNPVINMVLIAQTDGEKIGGTFVSADESGATMSSINIPEVSLKKGTNIISIREQNVKAGGDTITVVVKNLSSLTADIPESITFQTTSSAVNEFSFSTPLQFGQDASIVYDHPVSGWNKSVKKLSLKNVVKDGQNVLDGYIKMTAKLENKIPAYIKIEAYGLDINGDSISTDRLNVDIDKVVPASLDGKTAVNDDLSIIITPKDNDVFKTLDGIDLRFTASTNHEDDEPVTGVIINSRYQTFKATNIKVTIFGSLVGDFN